MEAMIDTAKKKVLIDIVKLVQKKGLKGKLGDWKEFLDSYDKKFGANLSDPAKRSHEILAAFLNTFTKEDDLKFLFNILQQHSNKEVLEQLKDKSYDSPEQRNHFFKHIQSLVEVRPLMRLRFNMIRWLISHILQSNLNVEPKFRETSTDNAITLGFSKEQRLVQVTLQNPSYPLDYSFKSLDEGWVVINLKEKNKAMRCTSMVAVDCEMVLCEDGTEALVKVCVVDRNLEVKLHELVNPNKAIADYRTNITGVSSQDLEGVTCSLMDIQKSMKRLLSDGNILVGHSLHNDLCVLKIDHVKVVDTSYIFQCLDGPIHKRPSLNSLCKAVLGYDVREKGAAHSCLDDACAAMKLVLAKIKLGIDREIPLIQEHIPESEMTKLLLHGIPISVNMEELHNVVPGDFTIELKPSKKGRGEKYSALAIFTNPQEARQAYENIRGRQEKDSAQRPQKLVAFQLGTGMTASLYVRKMLRDDPHDQIPSKRALQVDDAFGVSKKAKMDPKIEEDALAGSNKNEIEALRQQLKQNDMLIESLRQQLKQKDFENSRLHKLISSLKKGKKKMM